MNFLKLLFLSSLSIMLLGIGCRNQEDPNSAREELIESLNPGSILVENGQAAIVKLPKGYLFVVPRKVDYATGFYKVFYSESGNFIEDKVILTEGHGNLSAMHLSLKGYKILFIAGSRTSVYIELGLFDPLGISLYPNTDCNTVDIKSIDFAENPGPDNKAMQKFL